MTAATPESTTFELEWSGGAAERLHRRSVGDLDAQYAWESLDASQYPDALVDAARVGWTENAFNEFTTYVVMGQLLQALGEARAPLDLMGMAASFPAQELLHVELCARVAMQLGGGAPLRYDPATLAMPLDPSLTPLQRANELMVRICCVGETLSLPLLSGCARDAAHPLTRAVLQQIVQDEAGHGRLGWLYLDWVSPMLSASERDRLGQAASDTLRQHAPIWERQKSRVEHGVTSEGYLLEHIHQLGWMESQEYVQLATGSIEKLLRPRLQKHGITLRW